MRGTCICNLLGKKPQLKKHRDNWYREKVTMRYLTQQRTCVIISRPQDSGNTAERMFGKIVRAQVWAPAVVVACTKSIQDQVSQYPIMPAWRRGSLSLTPSWGAVDRWCLLGQERQAGFFQGRGLWQVAQAPVSGSTPHPCTYGQRWLASMSYKMGNKKLEGERGKSEKSWLGLYMCVKLLNHE